MTQLLVSGERARAFYVSFDLPDEAAKREFENATDIFEWLESRPRAALPAALDSRRNEPEPAAVKMLPRKFSAAKAVMPLAAVDKSAVRSRRVLRVGTTCVPV